jgi:hypothetical protein
VKDAHLWVKPGDIVMYSPQGTKDEYPAKVLAWPADWGAESIEFYQSVNEVYIEVDFGLRHYATKEKVRLNCLVWGGRIRFPSRVVAEDKIRDRLTEMTADTLGLDVPREVWGTL